jgi:arginyl-tRNA synthetase
MDNNVSKNTFSHNFFKVRFTQEPTSISVKSLLARRLLQTINLYQQKFNLQLDLKFFSTMINDKVMLASFYWQTLPLENQSNQILSKLYPTTIVYTSPIALVLSQYLSISPARIAENLVKLFTLNQNNSLVELSLQLTIEIVPSGWLNFSLDSKALANWLKQSVFFLATQPPVAGCNTRQAQTISTQRTKTPKNISNLMPLQYVHARCCSLLRLGARAKLITLQNDYFSNIAWQLEHPQSISWLDKQQNFCLTQESEYYLLKQLLIVTDAFVIEPHNWVKLAFDLSIASEIFQAECRFLGEVKQQIPIAIARLGLIALAQYWLQRILVEKLNTVALSSL